MMVSDLWSGLWMLVDQYPWLLAILVVLLVCFVGTVVACALMGLSRSEDDQMRYRPATGLAGLDKPTHNVHIQPAADLIPWGRRIPPPADKT